MPAVGVVTGHGELLTPRQAGFSRFFSMLAADGATVEALERPRFPADLRGSDALVLGAPGAPLEP